MSQFAKTINEITGTKHRHGSALHPQTQGAVEITAEAAEIIRQTKNVQDQAQHASHRAQETQRRQANKKRRPVDFVTGDKVFVSKKGFTTSAATTRLDSQWSGPFDITGECGHSFILDIPTSHKGSSLFHADRRRKAATDPLPQQRADPPQAEEINGEPEYEVDKVIASRLSGRGKTLQCQIAWRGCDPDETWYNARNLKHSPIAIREFHDKHSTAPGPPKRIHQWITDGANDTCTQDHKDDNRAEHEDLSGTKPKRSRRH